MGGSALKEVRHTAMPAWTMGGEPRRDTCILAGIEMIETLSFSEKPG